MDGRLQHNASEGKQKDRKYLIPANWWRKWCDYVNFGEAQNTEGDTSGNEQPMSDVCSLPLRLEDQRRRVKKQAMQLYESPGRIENWYFYQYLLLFRVLIKPGKGNHLKPNLIEHFDYEAVTKDVWLRLNSWFSCDFAVCRLIRRDDLNRTRVFLDLYPEMGSRSDDDSEEGES